LVFENGNGFSHYVDELHQFLSNEETGKKAKTKTVGGSKGVGLAVRLLHFLDISIHAI
jgi:hypothetical protein